MKRLAIIDLDSMLHTVAWTQWQAGNRDNDQATINHVKRFYNTIKKKSECTHALPVFQGEHHMNFRKDILKEYKGHRKTLEHVKHWKPTVMKAFDELGGICLGSIESDDAQSIIARDFGYENCVIVSGDKDMNQVPGTHYNPYKPKITWEERWKTYTPAQSLLEFYVQVMTGDPTDMPGSLCGVEKVAEKTAKKIYGNSTDYMQLLQKTYSDKYGKAGFARANITYKMVRLLTGEPEKDAYATPGAKIEVQHILKLYPTLIKPIGDDVAELFGKSSSKNLFNP